MANKEAVRLPTETEPSEFTRTVWAVTIDNITAVEELSNKDYWAHIASKFKAGDRIEVTPKNKSYFAELFILGCSKNWAKVILLRHHVIIKDVEASVDKDNFKIEFTDIDKWRVTKNNKVLAKDFDEKKEAKIWLDEYKKEMK